MFNKKEIIPLYCLIIFGMLVALKLCHIDYMINYSKEAYRSFCNINQSFNCDAVAASHYSHILGIPIAFIGFWSNLFLLIFIPIGYHLKQTKEFMKHFMLLIFSLYALGSLALAYISFFIMKNVCYICIVYWIISILTFIYLLYISKLKSILNSFWPMLKKVPTLVPFIFFYLSVLSGLKFILPSEGRGQVLKIYQNYDLKHNQSYLGLTTAPFVVEIYTDFQCPFCKKVHDYLIELVNKYGDMVKFVRKDFPLDKNCNHLLTKKQIHPMACISAYYSKCAGKQGKYWAYHDRLLEYQDKLGLSTLIDVANGLSLNIEELKACANSKEIHQAVQNEIKEAISHKIKATPTFRVFVENYAGYFNEKILKEYLKKFPFIDLTIINRLKSKDLMSELQLINTDDEHSKSRENIDPCKSILIDGKNREKLLDDYRFFKSKLNPLCPNALIYETK